MRDWNRGSASPSRNPAGRRACCPALVVVDAPAASYTLAVDSARGELAPPAGRLWRRPSRRRGRPLVPHDEGTQCPGRQAALPHCASSVGAVFFRCGRVVVSLRVGAARHCGLGRGAATPCSRTCARASGLRVGKKQNMSVDVEGRQLSRPNDGTRGCPFESPALVCLSCFAVHGPAFFRRCCLGMDVQCYEKDSNWAQCRSECVPGAHADDNNGVWSCNKLGPRSYGMSTKGFPSLYCFAVIRTNGCQCMGACRDCMS